MVSEIEWSSSDALCATFLLADSARGLEFALTLLVAVCPVVTSQRCGRSVCVPTSGSCKSGRESATPDDDGIIIGGVSRLCS